MGRIVITTVLAGLALMAACTPATDQPEAAGAAAPVRAAPLTADGAAAELQRQPVDSNLTWAASVVQLDILSNEANGGAKLFGLAGGDPAMNGLHTYLAFYESPGDGWQVFQLGDFLEYRVLSEAPGRVDLEITESTMDATSGAIGSQTRHVIVTWTASADGAAPESIALTSASAT